MHALHVHDKHRQISCTTNIDDVLYLRTFQIFGWENTRNFIDHSSRPLSVIMTLCIYVNFYISLSLAYSYMCCRMQLSLHFITSYMCYGMQLSLHFPLWSPNLKNIHNANRWIVIVLLKVWRLLPERIGGSAQWL